MRKTFIYLSVSLLTISHLCASPELEKNVNLIDNLNIPNQKVEVLNAWARPQALGRNTAIYLELVNPQGTPDELLEAHCRNCERIEFHTHQEENGVMRMEKVGFIEIPQQGNQRLEPGGMHIMCMGINKTLQPGDVVTIDLKFKNSGDLTARIPVKDND